MSELLQIIIVFAIYITVILIIAIIGKYVTRNLSDYILAGRRLSGPIAALGAGASDMSSWLTMALPGLIYIKVLQQIWMPVGLLIGAWFNWIFVAKRLRIYTEVANDCLMFVALLIVPIVTVNNLGGVELAVSAVHKINYNYLNFSDIKILGLISLLVWGLGYFGQPHINVRFMAIRTIIELPIARRIYMGWMLLSLFGAIATGFFGIAYYGQHNLQSPDTVFLALSRALFNPWLTGVLWSAVLASIMNSVSAHILTTASIVVEDFYHISRKKVVSDRQYLFAGKIIMIIVSILAVLLALDQSKTILDSVAFAWSGLGAAFGPTILCSLYWRRMTKTAAIWGIIVGMVAVLITQQFLNHPDIGSGFVILPGFLLSVLTIVMVTLFTKAPPQEVLKKFDIMLEQIKSQ